MPTRTVSSALLDVARRWRLHSAELTAPLHHKQQRPHDQPAWLLLMKASAPAVGLIVSWTHGTRPSASGR